MRIAAGTSGFSYAAWKGPFYPEELKNGEMLRFYATRLPAVEINNTFYRMPKASVLAGWAEQVPEAFRFALKASRRITHFARLRDCAEETDYLVRTARTLGSRLGALLFQLPPNLKADLPRLEAFLELVPADVPAVFEFRHESWRDAAVHGALRARGRGLVHVDADDSEASAEVVCTSPLAYLRLRRESYADAHVAAWAARVAALPVEEALVFFKHEDAGAGPRLAEAFLTAAGAAPGAPAPARALPARTRRRRESA